MDKNNVDDMIIGSHVSISNGLLGAAAEARSYNANAFMIYTGAPQNTVRKPLKDMRIAEGHEYMDREGFAGFVVHAPYIINLASPEERTYDLAVSFLKKEIERTNGMGAKYLILHPGSYTVKDLEFGLNRIIYGLDEVFSESGEVVVCLETMAGKGGEVGKTFEELASIINGVKNPERLAVCFDTCHVHDAGYDIVNDLDGVMNEFDKALGLDFIKIFHLNGSLNAKGARKDRHANIGARADNIRGADHIGFAAINALAHSRYARGRYLILETPWISPTENLYKQEIAALRGEA